MESTSENANMGTVGSSLAQPQAAPLLDAVLVHRLEFFAWVTIIVMAFMGILQLIGGIFGVNLFLQPDPDTGGPFSSQTDRAWWNLLLSCIVVYLLLIADSAAMVFAGVGILKRKAKSRKLAMPILKINLAIALMLLMGSILMFVLHENESDLLFAIIMQVASLGYIFHSIWGLLILRISRCQTYFEQ